MKKKILILTANFIVLEKGEEGSLARQAHQ
jgi:hypothetical protein